MYNTIKSTKLIDKPSDVNVNKKHKLSNKLSRHKEPTKI